MINNADNFEISKPVKKTGKTYELSFSDLFPDSFISQNSQYKNIEELFTASGYSVKSMKDFIKIPDNEWEKFVVHNTRFNSWEEMMSLAVRAWTTKKLGLNH